MKLLLDHISFVVLNPPNTFRYILKTGLNKQFILSIFGLEGKNLVIEGNKEKDEVIRASGLFDILFHFRMKTLAKNCMCLLHISFDRNQT